MITFKIKSLQTKRLKTKLVFTLLLTINACDSAVTQSADKTPVQGHSGDFRVEHCSLTYRGKSLTFGVSVDEWVAVMGPFDHWHELVSDVYVWDDLGVALYAEPGTYEARSFNFKFNNQLPFNEQDIAAAKPLGTDDFKRQINAAMPKSNFDSMVWVNGALISKTWNASAAKAQMFQHNAKAKSVFEQGYSATHFVSYIRCPLDKYPGYKNKEMLFRVNTDVDDLSKVEALSVGIRLAEQ